MVDELIPITLHKVIQSRGYTAIILATEEKKFSIYTDPQVGLHLQKYLAQEEMPRPYTHDFIRDIFEGFNIKALQVVIQDLEDTVYFARIFLEQCSDNQRQILEIDARPSDTITLALILKIPLFCRKTVLEKVIAIED